MLAPRCPRAGSGQAAVRRNVSLNFVGAHLVPHNHQGRRLQAFGFAAQSARAHEAHVPLGRQIFCSASMKSAGTFMWGFDRPLMPLLVLCSFDLTGNLPSARMTSFGPLHPTIPKSAPAPKSSVVSPHGSRALLVPLRLRFSGTVRSLSDRDL